MCPSVGTSESTYRITGPRVTFCLSAALVFCVCVCLSVQSTYRVPGCVWVGTKLLVQVVGTMPSACRRKRVKAKGPGEQVMGVETSEGGETSGPPTGKQLRHTESKMSSTEMEKETEGGFA